MTPEELRSAMNRLGMSTTQLAVVLRLGKGGDSTVRKWLRGDRSIPGPAAVSVELLLASAPNGGLTQRNTLRTGFDS